MQQNGFDKYEDRDHYVIEQAVAAAIEDLKNWMKLAAFSLVLGIGSLALGTVAWFSSKSTEYSTSHVRNGQEHIVIEDKIDEILQVLK